MGEHPEPAAPPQQLPVTPRPAVPFPRGLGDLGWGAASCRGAVTVAAALPGHRVRESAQRGRGRRLGATLTLRGRRRTVGDGD